MKINLTFILGCLIVISCSGRRVDSIEETFGIRLPEKYEVLTNTTESVGFAGADFEINVKLKFPNKEFKVLQEELNKIDSLKAPDSQTYYFNNNKGEIGFLQIDSAQQILEFKFNHI